MNRSWRNHAHRSSSFRSERRFRRSPPTVHFGSPESDGFSLQATLPVGLGRRTPRTYRIGIIGGDGIGPEVVTEAVKALDATGVPYEAVPFDLGWERYERD